MHIAVGVWGLVRTLQYTVGTFQEHCLDPITRLGHTYELFVHTFTLNGTYANRRNAEGPVKLNNGHWDLLKPNYITIERQEDFDNHINFTEYQTRGDPWGNKFEAFKNNLRATYLLQQLTLDIERRSKSVHFDGIVFLRPDVAYLSDLPIYLLNEFIDTLFLPDFQRTCKEGQ